MYYKLICNDFIISDIIKLTIIEEINKLPVFEISILKNLKLLTSKTNELEPNKLKLNKLKDCKFVVQYSENSSTIIDLVVVSYEVNGQLIDLKLQPKAKQIQKKQSDDLFEKFKQNNPNLFVSEQKYIYDIHGNLVKNNCKNPAFKSLDFESLSKNIVANSFKINIDNTNQIDQIQLQLEASWMHNVFGRMDLSNKIRMAFRGKQINTLTSKNFISSWPKVFDKIAVNHSKNTRSTKYFVYHTRLSKDYKIPVILNIDKTHKVQLYKQIFNHKLIIAWEYDQLEKEQINLTIYNNALYQDILRHSTKCLDTKCLDTKCFNTKQVKIDLHNVQEYFKQTSSEQILSEQTLSEQVSFFASELGNKICNAIIRELQQLIIDSMQNVVINFQLTNQELFSIHLNDSIIINDYIVYISKIVYNENFVNIEARGNESYHDKSYHDKSYHDKSYHDKSYHGESYHGESYYDKSYHGESYYDKLHNNSEDIIEYNIKRFENINVLKSIVVTNDSEEQINKLKSLKLSVTNYKSEINKCLNANKTSISITTKPLKKSVLNLQTIQINQPLSLSSKLKINLVNL